MQLYRVGRWSFRPLKDLKSVLYPANLCRINEVMMSVENSQCILHVGFWLRVLWWSEAIIGKVRRGEVHVDQREINVPATLSFRVIGHMTIPDGEIEGVKSRFSIIHGVKHICAEFTGVSSVRKGLTPLPILVPSGHVHRWPMPLHVYPNEREGELAPQRDLKERKDRL